GRVDHAQVVATFDGEAAVDLDLAPEVHQEGAIGDVQHVHPFERADTADDGVGVRLVARGDGEVAHHLAAADANDIDGADVAALLADRGGQTSEGARTVARLGAQDEAVAGARLEQHYSGF